MLMPRTFCSRSLRRTEVIHAYFVSLLCAVTGWQLDNFSKRNDSRRASCWLCARGFGAWAGTPYKLTAVLIPVSVGLALLVRRDWRGLVLVRAMGFFLASPCWSWISMVLAVRFSRRCWLGPFRHISFGYLILRPSESSVPPSLPGTWVHNIRLRPRRCLGIMCWSICASPVCMVDPCVSICFARIVRKRTSHIGVILGCHVIMTLLFFAGRLANTIRNVSGGLSLADHKYHDRGWL